MHDDADKTTWGLLHPLKNFETIGEPHWNTAPKNAPAGIPRPLLLSSCRSFALLTSERNFVVGPCSADSANSVHGSRSRVQNANGITKWTKRCGLRRFSEPVSNKLTPRLLKTDDVGSSGCSGFDHSANLLVQLLLLFVDWSRRWQYNGVLNGSDSYLHSCK